MITSSVNDSTHVIECCLFTGRGNTRMPVGGCVVLEQGAEWDMDKFLTVLFQYGNQTSHYDPVSYGKLIPDCCESIKYSLIETVLLNAMKIKMYYPQIFNYCTYGFIL